MNSSNLTSQTTSVSDVAAQVAEQASDLSHRGTEAILASGRQIRDKAQTLSDSTINYIKEEPVKAILIAAATGAVLMAMLSLVSRAGHRG